MPFYKDWQATQCTDLNKFNNSFSNEELASVTSDELIQKIKSINNYEQTVIYYPRI
jgi:hypothetical protein